MKGAHSVMIKKQCPQKLVMEVLWISLYFFFCKKDSNSVN